MADASSAPDWPAEGLKTCVRQGRWDGAQDAFSNIKKIITHHDPEAYAEHAELTWDFLLGFAERRNIYKRQVVECARSLSASQAFRNAFAGSASLRERAKGILAEDDIALLTNTSAPAPGTSASTTTTAAQPKVVAQTSSGPSSKASRESSTKTTPASAPKATVASSKGTSAADAGVAAAKGSATGGYTSAPAAPGKASAGKLAVPGAQGAATADRHGDAASSAAEEELDKALAQAAAIVEPRSKRWEEGGADDAFGVLRRAALHMSAPQAFLDRVEERAVSVLTFVLEYARRKKTKVRQVCELLRALLTSPKWSATLKGNAELVRFVNEEVPASVGEVVGLPTAAMKDAAVEVAAMVRSHSSDGLGHNAKEDADIAPVPVGTITSTGCASSTMSEEASPPMASTDSRKHRVQRRMSRSLTREDLAPGLSSKPLKSPRGHYEVTSGPQLPLIDGDFSWVRRANGPQDRSLRQEVGEQTEIACQKGGYVLNGQHILLTRLTEMQAQTRFISPHGRHVGEAPLKGLPKKGAVTWGRHAPGLMAKVAVERTLAGHAVATVNAASAYHVGGGFKEGGRHALEESLCVQSTLYRSLLVAEAQAELHRIKPPAYAVPPRCPRDGKPWHCHIPEDGALLSPHVEIFRDGTNEGYPFLAKPVTLCAVISVAMFNCNPRVRDAPVDAPAVPEVYESMLRRKCKAVCEAILEAGARVLVVPDIGCGVYGNDPKKVGNAMGLALACVKTPGGGRLLDELDEIHTVGLDAFCDGVQEAATAAAGNEFEESPKKNAGKLETAGDYWTAFSAGVSRIAGKTVEALTGVDEITMAAGGGGPPAKRGLATCATGGPKPGVTSMPKAKADSAFGKGGQIRQPGQAERPPPERLPTMASFCDKP